MFTLRDDEADARMRDLRDQFLRCKYKLKSIILPRLSPVTLPSVAAKVAEYFNKNGTNATVDGNTVTLTVPYVGTYNVSIGVAPHA